VATIRFIYGFSFGFNCCSMIEFPFLNTGHAAMAAGMIDRLFLAHPRSAGQGYFEHMRFAWSFAVTLAVAAAAALVHGLFPFVCQTAAGDRVRSLYARLSGRAHDTAS